LAISFQTIAELYEWALLSRWGPGRIGRLRVTISGLLILDPDDTTCRHFAEVRVARKGRPISAADAWIAATALANGLELVTHNPADFRGIPGLTVITEAP